MKHLLHYFPNHPREEECEKLRAELLKIDELIYRTVGRIPGSEFLFRGNRGKRYEKKLRTGRGSHINDRYMHPLDIAIRDRKQKEQEARKY